MISYLQHQNLQTTSILNHRCVYQLIYIDVLNRSLGARPTNVHAFRTNCYCSRTFILIRRIVSYRAFGRFLEMDGCCLGEQLLLALPSPKLLNLLRCLARIAVLRRPLVRQEGASCSSIHR